MRPFHHRFDFLLLIVTTTLASPGRADEAPAPAESPTEATGDPRPPAEVVVRGRAQAPVRAASDLVLPVDALRRVPRKNATELLELAPGVYLTNEGGEGHAERIFLRGFDTHEGEELELSVDGVPLNESGNLHGSGYADAHFLIPELVHSVRVLEGPFDPRQGNFAVAGSARYELGLSRRGITASYGRGSFDTERALVTFGPPGESIRTFAGAELYRTAGYGDSRSARHARAMGQYEGSLGRSGSFRVGGAAQATEYRAAGLVRADDVAAGRVARLGTHDARQGGNASRFQLSADAETRARRFLFSQQLFVIRRTFGVRENFTGVALDQRGDLIDLAVRESTFGGRGFARTQTEFGGLEQELEVGYFARADATSGTRRRLDSASGDPYATETDIDATLGDFGVYGDVALRPLRGVTLRGGARADLFTYDVLLRQEPPRRSSAAAASVMPRASVSLGPVRHFTATLAWGKGLRSADPSDVADTSEAPFAELQAAEGGVVYARTFDALSLTARSVFFHTHVDRDLSFSETEGRSVLGGGTSRSGWTGAAQLALGPLEQSAGLTLVRASFDDTGLTLPYAPAVVVRSDSVLDAELPFDLGGARPNGSLALGLSYVGRRTLPLGQETAPSFLVDASAGVRYRAWALDLEVGNVLDVRHRTAEDVYVSDFRSGPSPTLAPARHYAAGPPRAIMLSVSMTAGGEP